MKKREKKIDKKMAECGMKLAGVPPRMECLEKYALERAAHHANRTDRHASDGLRTLVGQIH